jgi:threonine dehydrogenase-like Zn-dependent dehydrogenase
VAQLFPVSYRGILTGRLVIPASLAAPWRSERGLPVLAAVTRSPGNVVIDDIPEPGPPQAGRVVVRPEAVGICGSDLHHFSGHTSALSGAQDFYPRIQGHEIAAVVDQAGDNAPPHLAPGMRVAVMPETRCGHCYPCRTGRPNVCVNLRLVGVHLDGGLAQRLDIAAKHQEGLKRDENVFRHAAYLSPGMAIISANHSMAART